MRWSIGEGMAPEWYARFGDVPGVLYETPPGIDRSRIPGASSRPKLYKSYDGSSSLTWGEDDEWTSASPAQERSFDDTSRYSNERLGKHLAEVLELPGEASDYHFAIQNTVEEFWRRRKNDAKSFEEIERLGRLDIELIQAKPEAVTSVVDGERTYYQVLTFQRLIYIYEREGAWREALDVAEIALRFDQQERKAEELRERVAALDAEGAR